MVVRIGKVTRLFPLNRCRARFRVVSGLGELGISPLSYLENPVVTLWSVLITWLHNYSAVANH